MNNGNNTPRLEERRHILSSVFSVQKMDECWKKYIREGLRKQEVLDLFDYNDFHWNKDDRLEELHKSIIEGRYRVSYALTTKIEKKHGVCRTIVTPSAEDAIILQCISERLLPDILKKQPSRNSFFSRSHGFSNATFEFGKDYIWFKQWAKFSQKRISFSTKSNYIITTDISTYFDNVQYGHLRNILSHYSNVEEVILDILFKVLDSLCWRPDYLPSPNASLPQVQFDAPRLLAHAYLFEIDQYLKKTFSNKFVRWVDDITVAVDSYEDCKIALRDIDALLHMRGLRINSGKTHILSATKARSFFHSRKNSTLTKWTDEAREKVSKNLATKSFAKKVKLSFDNFIAGEQFGHSDKVIKRYLGIFIILKADEAISFCLKSFTFRPELRDTIYRYFEALGPSSQVMNFISRYLTSSHALDDASVFQLSEVLTNWEITPNSKEHKEIKKLINKISTEKFINGNEYRFISALWLISKYESQKFLTDFLSRTLTLWKNSEFLSRQAAASSAKIRGNNSHDFVVAEIRRNNYKSALNVIDTIEKIRKIKKTIPKEVSLYVLNGKQKSIYKLSRFLTAFALLTSHDLDPTAKKSLINQMLNYISDPLYRDVLSKL